MRQVEQGQKNETRRKDETEESRQKVILEISKILSQKENDGREYCVVGESIDK